MDCDLLVKAKYVLPINKSLEIIEDGYVAIASNKIVALGRQSDAEGFKTKEIIDAGKAILMPGLVNTHTHAAMVAFRGLADDLPLDEWLNKHIWPAEGKSVKPDFMRVSTKLACLEMIRSGTTCFSDMYFFEEIVGEVAESIGMRAVLSETVLNFPTPSCLNSDDVYKRVIEQIEKFKNSELIKIAIAPHAVYTVSEENLLKVKDVAEKYNLRIHIHVSESKKEVDDCQEKTGKTPVEYLDGLGMLNDRTMAAHSIWLDGSDLELFAARKVNVLHCQASNMKLASGVAAVSKMIEMNIVVGLGTDGAASNNTLDIFNEMRLVALSHKVINNNPTVVNAREVVKMATINGANALGLSDIAGSLEVGKRADMISIDLDQPHLMPIYDPYSHLVYAAKGSDVKDVIINGKVVMRDKKVLTIDEEVTKKEIENFKV